MKPEILFKETITKENLQKIQNLFPIKHFSFGEIIYGGKIIVSIVEFEDTESLEDNWSLFNSYMSSEFLSNIKNEFSKWNFYVFYISSEEIGIDLKYEIENNKFGSRKALIDSFKQEINVKNITNLIKEHITNQDIIEVKVPNKKLKLKKDIIISNALSEVKRPKEKNTYNEYLVDVLVEIEKKMTDEV